MDKPETIEPSPQAREWIELKLGALRSEMRTLFVLSVAGNQLLSHLALAPTIGYISNGALIVGVIVVKGSVFFR